VLTLYIKPSQTYTVHLYLIPDLIQPCVFVHISFQPGDEIISGVQAIS